MCVRYRFYHLCGHTHRITKIPCAYVPAPLRFQPIPKGAVDSSSAGSSWGPPTCLSDPGDWLEEIRLLPTLCSKCEQICIISDWLYETPGSRLKVVRAWSKKHRPNLHKWRTLENGNIELEISDSEDGGIDSGNTTVDTDMTASTGQQPLTTRTGSTEPPKRTPTFILYESKTDTSLLQARMAVLKTRVMDHIAELRYRRH